MMMGYGSVYVHLKKQKNIHTTQIIFFCIILKWAFVHIC